VTTMAARLAVQSRLQQLCRRPGPPAQVVRSSDVDVPAPADATWPPGEDLLWERWEIQTEPGQRGRVPILLVRQRFAQGRLPVAVIQHSTGRSKEYLGSNLARFACKGFLAVSFDNRYHGERGTKEDYHAALIRAWRENWAGDEAEAPTPKCEHPYIYDSVWDLSRVLDLLVQREDVDRERIGVTGVSLGGMQTWLGAVADSRIACVAPAIGVQSFRYACEYNCWQARAESVRPLFDAAAIDLAGFSGYIYSPEIDAACVEQVWRRLCPGLLGELDGPSSLSAIAPRPLLVLSGELDPRCPLEGVRQAVVAAEAEYRQVGAPPATVRWFVDKGIGHEMTPAMWEEIENFFVEHLLQPRVRPGSGNTTCTSCWAAFLPGSR